MDLSPLIEVLRYITFIKENEPYNIIIKIEENIQDLDIEYKETTLEILKVIKDSFIYYKVTERYSNSEEYKSKYPLA